MTTIAWDGTHLAADTQISDMSMIAGYREKLIKVNNAWFGVVGSLSSGYEVLEWLRSGANAENKPMIEPGEFNGVLLDPTGLYEYESDLVKIDVVYTSAWGTGRPWAIAAMDYGATAEEAIRYTITKDIYTSGEIQVVTFA
jgi:hypothetical protein